jgi:hypothetical protein
MAKWPGVLKGLGNPTINKPQNDHISVSVGKQKLKGNASNKLRHPIGFSFLARRLTNLATNLGGLRMYTRNDDTSKKTVAVYLKEDHHSKGEKMLIKVDSMPTEGQISMGPKNIA